MHCQVLNNGGCDARTETAAMVDDHNYSCSTDNGVSPRQITQYLQYLVCDLSQIPMKKFPCVQ